jgi:hypothetical protein
MFEEAGSNALKHDGSRLGADEPVTVASDYKVLRSFALGVGRIRWHLFLGRSDGGAGAYRGPCPCAPTNRRLLKQLVYQAIVD